MQNESSEYNPPIIKHSLRTFSQVLVGLEIISIAIFIFFVITVHKMWGVEFKPNSKFQYSEELNRLYGIYAIRSFELLGILALMGVVLAILYSVGLYLAKKYKITLPHKTLAFILMLPSLMILLYVILIMFSWRSS